MNLKISFYVLISFLAAFSVFSFVMFLPSSRIQAETPLPENMENYLAVQQEFFSKIDPQEKNIFILGSSYIMAINTTQIHNNLVTNGDDYRVYNLAIFGDDIQKRAKTIDMIISAKPEIVVYGIAEDDFADPLPINAISAKPASVLPDPHEFFDNGLNAFETSLNLDFPNSPKTITWLNIRDVMGTRTNSEKWHPYQDSPFMEISTANTVPISDLALKNQVNYITAFGKIKHSQDNKHLKVLKEILEQLKENDIKVILFVVPHHDYLISKAPHAYEETFTLILSDIENQQNSKIYKRQNYSDLPIWHDLTHVAVNEKSVIFSDDIAKMILDVIR